jgi:hypothetical protein
MQKAKGKSDQVALRASLIGGEAAAENAERMRGVHNHF